MHWTTKTLLIASLASTVAACGGNAGTDSGSKAQKAATIAKEIQASPDDYEKVLEKHGLDADGFEALMFEVAEDPALSDEYAKAMGN